MKIHKKHQKIREKQKICFSKYIFPIINFFYIKIFLLSYLYFRFHTTGAREVYRDLQTACAKYLKVLLDFVYTKNIAT